MAPPSAQASAKNSPKVTVTRPSAPKKLPPFPKPKRRVPPAPLPFDAVLEEANRKAKEKKAAEEDFVADDEFEDVPGCQRNEEYNSNVHLQESRSKSEEHADSEGDEFEEVLMLVNGGHSSNKKEAGEAAKHLSPLNDPWATSTTNSDVSDVAAPSIDPLPINGGHSSDKKEAAKHLSPLNDPSTMSITESDVEQQNTHPDVAAPSTDPLPIHGGHSSNQREVENPLPPPNDVPVTSIIKPDVEKSNTHSDVAAPKIDPLVMGVGSFSGNSQAIEPASSTQSVIVDPALPPELSFIREVASESLGSKSCRQKSLRQRQKNIHHRAVSRSLSKNGGKKLRKKVSVLQQERDALMKEGQQLFNTCEAVKAELQILKENPPPTVLVHQPAQPVHLSFEDLQLQFSQEISALVQARVQEATHSLSIQNVSLQREMVIINEDKEKKLKTIGEEAEKLGCLRDRQTLVIENLKGLLKDKEEMVTKAERSQSVLENEKVQLAAKIDNLKSTIEATKITSNEKLARVRQDRDKADAKYSQLAQSSKKDILQLQEKIDCLEDNIKKFKAEVKKAAEKGSDDMKALKALHKAEVHTIGEKLNAEQSKKDDAKSEAESLKVEVEKLKASLAVKAAKEVTRLQELEERSEIVALGVKNDLYDSEDETYHLAVDFEEQKKAIAKQDRTIKKLRRRLMEANDKLESIHQAATASPLTPSVSVPVIQLSLSHIKSVEVAPTETVEVAQIDTENAFDKFFNTYVLPPSYEDLVVPSHRVTTDLTHVNVQSNNISVTSSTSRSVSFFESLSAPFIPNPKPNPGKLGKSRKSRRRPGRTYWARKFRKFRNRVSGYVPSFCPVTFCLFLILMGLFLTFVDGPTPPSTVTPLLFLAERVFAGDTIDQSTPFLDNFVNPNDTFLDQPMGPLADPPILDNTAFSDHTGSQPIDLSDTSDNNITLTRKSESPVFQPAVVEAPRVTTEVMVKEAPKMYPLGKSYGLSVFLHDVYSWLENSFRRTYEEVLKVFALHGRIVRTFRKRAEGETSV